MQTTYLTRILMLGIILLSFPTLAMTGEGKKNADKDIGLSQLVKDLKSDLGKYQNTVRNATKSCRCPQCGHTWRSYENSDLENGQVWNYAYNSTANNFGWHYPHDPWKIIELAQRPENSDDVPVLNTLRKYYAAEYRGELGKVSRKFQYWMDFDENGIVINSEWIPKRTDPDCMWQQKNQAPKEPTQN
jgi:hypothetical protein